MVVQKISWNREIKVLTLLCAIFIFKRISRVYAELLNIQLGY